MATRRPSREHVAAWRALLTVHARVLSQLDQDLKDQTDLDMQIYDTLLHVFEAGQDGVRMSVLADKVVLTRAGLTSLVDRIEARRFLRRVDDPNDRRATRIVLTDLGEATFRAAAKIHLAGIETFFASYLDEGDADVLTATLAKVGAAENDRAPA